jgi:hypothetical protein
MVTKKNPYPPKVNENTRTPGESNFRAMVPSTARLKYAGWYSLEALTVIRPWAWRRKERKSAAV